jgi:hypothetical protein
MSHPAAASPFAYLLPTHASSQARETAPPLVTAGSARTRLLELVLTFLVLAGGLALALPSGPA